MSTINIDDLSRIYTLQTKYFPSLSTPDAYDASHLTYKWKKKPGIKIMDNKMAQFQLVRYETVGNQEKYVAGNTLFRSRDVLRPDSHGWRPLVWL